MRTPLLWHQSVQSFAHQIGRHVDDVYSWLDSGALRAAVLVAKSDLPFDIPGPSPKVVVLLHDYLTLPWTDMDGERVAALSGEYQAFGVYGQELVNYTIADAAGIVVSRGDLVITLHHQEAMEEEVVETPRERFNKTERTSVMRMLGAALRHAYPHETRPQTIAKALRQSMGADALSVTAMAPKIKEALAVSAQESTAIAQDAPAEVDRLAA